MNSQRQLDHFSFRLTIILACLFLSASGVFAVEPESSAEGPAAASMDTLQALSRSRLIIYAAGQGLPSAQDVLAGRDASADFSYREFGDAELIGLVGGAGIGLLSHYAIGGRLLTEAEIERLTPDSVRSFFPFTALDRSAAYNWNPAADAASDWLVYAGLAAPLAVSVFALPSGSANASGVDAGDYLGSYAQTLTLGLGLNMLVKNLVARRRPYLFNPDLSLEEKMYAAPDYTRSFFSGHTMMSFSSAAFVTGTYWDMYPNRDSRYAVGLLSFASAALTGYMRYEAGKHYPSDIVVGAVVGTALGLFIPMID